MPRRSSRKGSRTRRTSRKTSRKSSRRLSRRKPAAKKSSRRRSSSSRKSSRRRSRKQSGGMDMIMGPSNEQKNIIAFIYNLINCASDPTKGVESCEPNSNKREIQAALDELSRQGKKRHSKLNKAIENWNYTFKRYQLS